ncbi:MAG: LysR family transcriptional regulator [Verrucomicrobia bacterium]|nr:LysR family transcriptional regulator [Verrucomicrobiota bacterium]
MHGVCRVGQIVELRLLRYFVAVAEELHFGRAAQRLHISQPPLSSQIRLLEDEVGVPLLLRTKRSVQLTPAGRAFLAEARQILDRTARAKEVARRAESTGATQLVVACGPVSMCAVVPVVLPIFRERCPGADLVLTESMPTGIIEGLQKGQLDAGLVVSYFDTIALKREIILSLPLAAVLAKSHPLAKQKRIRLTQLEGEPCVLLSRGMGSGFSQHIVGLFQWRGVTPRLAHEVTTLQALFAMVAAGYGVSLVPESLARLAGPGIAFVELQEPKPTIQLCMAWRANNVSPVLLTFLEVVRGCFRERT